MTKTNNKNYTTTPLCLLLALLLARNTLQACSDGCVTCYQNSICLYCQYGYDLDSSSYNCNEWSPLMTLTPRTEDAMNYSKL